MENIDSKLNDLQEDMLRFVKLNAKSGSENSRYDKDYEKLAEAIFTLRTQKDALLEQSAQKQWQCQKMAQMTEFLQEQGADITEYDDRIVRRMVDRILVNGDMLTVEFKSGIEIELPCRPV